MDKKITADIASKPNAKILIARTDRIGDVVLSTPVFTSIRQAKPGWKISALVRPLVSDLLEGHPDIDEVISLETDDKPGLTNTVGLSDILKEKRFDAVIHLYSDFWVSLSCWLAGIPLRIGPSSKIAQIFYNKRIVQKRSKNDRHETDCNLDLLEPFGISPIRKSSVPFIETVPEKDMELLDSKKKNVGIFPGMGGSARNWNPKKFAQLADMLESAGVNVILIAGPGEEPILDKVEGFSTSAKKRYIGSSLKRLAGFIKRLNCFVAPSTGPLHISSAVETPAVGIYCPIRVCLPSRWGPIGEKDIGIVPEVEICEKCSAENCEFYDCMDKLDVKPVFDAVMERL